MILHTLLSQCAPIPIVSLLEMTVPTHGWAKMSPHAPLAHEVLECVVAFRNEQHAELEIRMGSYVHGKFCPGISKDVFDQLHRDLAESAELKHDVGWVEVIDYFYTNERAELIRTRVEYDADKMEVGKCHVHKQSVQSVILRSGDNDGTRSAKDESYDEVCKLVLAIETPVTDPPVTCMPTYVRIKQRKCFRDIRSGGVVWSYELSKTWSANNRSAVEHLQLLSEPVYEVEIELVDENRTYLNAHCDEHIAASLLLKTKMLLGEEPTHSLQVVSSEVKKRNTNKKGRHSLR